MNRKMKKSNSFYLEMVPNDWSEIRFEQLINVLPKSNIQAGEGKEEGKYPFYTSSQELEKRIDECLYDGDAITMSTGGTASVNYSEVPFSTSTDCFNFKTNINTKYLYYYLFGIKDTVINDLWFKGIGLKHLQKYNLLKSHLFIPSKNEQNDITKFLDAKCLQIEGLISKHNQIIGKLEEYRKSYITKIVTNGIDNNVELKDSGIKWLGNIPKHWKIIKAKYVFGVGDSGIKVGPFGSALKGCMLPAGEYKVYNQANLIQNDFDISRHFVDNNAFERLQSYEILPGDILFSVMGTVGKCKQMPLGKQKGIMDSHLIKARMNGKMLPDYFEYVYDKDNSSVVIQQLLYLSQGSIMDGLNSTIISNLYLPLPPIDEQKQIVKHIENKCKKIDELILRQQGAIKKLGEYKKSLIYSAVTGKMEVK